MTGPNTGSSAVATIGKNRRLTLGVPLGPANPYQAETAEAAAAGTAVYTTYVRIKRLPEPSRTARRTP
jgi:hypothetical protein